MGTAKTAVNRTRPAGPGGGQRGPRHCRAHTAQALPGGTQHGVCRGHGPLAVAADRYPPGWWHRAMWFRVHLYGLLYSTARCCCNIKPLRC